MIFEKMQENLKKRWKSGESQTQIAFHSGLSQVHINRLLNSAPDIFASVALGNILRLFPGMRVLLPGDTASINQTGDNSIQNANGSININSRDRSEEMRQAIMRNLLACDDLPPEHLRTALKLITETHLTEEE